MSLALWLIAGCAAPSQTQTDVALEPTDVPQAGDAQADTAGCTAPPRTTPRWYDTAIGYEIFVRSFRDSDGDGIGDLAGLTASLDYLNDGDPETSTDLGVTLLWLMPIQESPSYHGYDVTDYERVEPDYGTDADLTALLAAAEARGIRVIADLVLNHTSSQHPWFVDALQGPSATYRSFYVWADEDLGWRQPWGQGNTWHKTPTGYYYGLFWDGMPDLNFTSQTVQATMTDVAKSWLGRGLAGFRLDAVRYLVETGADAGQKDTAETHAYWRRLREASEQTAPQALLLGEAWAGSSIVAEYFGSPDKPALHMAFDFDTAGGLVDALVTGHGGALRNALCARLDGWPTHGAAGTFATNHDMQRLASRLSVAGPDALRLVAAALLTLPGSPWIYYGQEIGMRNGPTHDDIDKRLPMQWEGSDSVGFTSGTPWASPQSTAVADSVAGQTDDADSLLSYYRQLIALRQSTASLQRGSTSSVAASGTAGTPFAMRRTLGDEVTVVVLNVSAETSTITLPAADLPAGESFVDLITAENVSVDGTTGDLVLLDLPAYGVRILQPSQ